jgi:transposase
VPGSPLEERLAVAETVIGELRRVVDVLQADNEMLRDRVAHLEAEGRKDSSTSSKPPSSDPVAPRKRRAERRAAERADKKAQGKQPGAPGANLQRRRPDVTVGHEPVECRCCGADLADAPVVGTVVRQVIDLPAVEAVVTDHVAYRRRCGCGAETVADLPPAARAPVCWGPEVRAFALYLLNRQHLPVERTAELLADVLGAPVSTGWLCNVQHEAAGRLAPFLAEVKTRLAVEPVICADETGTRVGTAKQWVHTVTTGLVTLLVNHPKRGVEAMADIGVFEDYTGTIVHDGLAAYDTYTAAGHAQCGAHLLRHLDDVGQTIAFTLWTRQLAGILIAARDASTAAADAGLASVPADIAAAVRADYRSTLAVAFALLPDGTPPRRRHAGGWNHAQRKAFNLATRLRTGETQVLRLLDDTRVPFTNNDAERSLRMVKIHDKVSGTFQSAAGAAHFTAVRSYMQTAAAHGENVLDVCRQLFTTGPWLPPPAGAT